MTAPTPNQRPKRRPRRRKQPRRPEEKNHTELSSHLLQPVALSLGSNVGPGIATLRWAIDSLERILEAVTVGSLYRTTPVSPIAQPEFFNTALVARTHYDPEALLGACKAVEWAAGRRTSQRLGPRVLDIDLLVWGDRVTERPELTLPHPELGRRRFYLEPLAEIAPDLPIPPHGDTPGVLLDRLAKLGDSAAVFKLDWPH